MRNVLKICTVAVLALVLVLGMVSAAFAAGSATEIVEFWDGDTKVSVTQDPPEELDAAKAAELAGVTGELAKFWYGEVESDNLTLKCKVQGAGSSDEYYVFHYKEALAKAETSGWEFVGKGTGAEFDVTFTSLSPVAVFKSGTPKTGDSSNMLLWGGLMVAAAAAAVGTVVYSKKRRTEA